MNDSPLLPDREPMPRATKARIIIAASRYYDDNPAMRDETSREQWSAYCMDRVTRGMDPLDITTRETIPVEHFTDETT